MGVAQAHPVFSGAICNSRCNLPSLKSAWLSGFGVSERPTPGAHACSYGFRPKLDLQYEHMFCSSPTQRFGRRLVEAAHLVRSFLLLEDELAVSGRRNVELDLEGSTQDAENSMVEDHPHRVALRSRLSVRRPGIVAPHEQVCLCPVGGRARAGVSRGSFSPQRSCAALPHGAGSSRNP